MAATKRKLTRAQKSELTRRNLLEAAVEVVGEQGYGNASVTDITTRARIAQGTFYNYFESKQDILDQLLPELGEVLLDYLGQQVGDATFLEREEKSVRAYFRFIREHPEFYRILMEAQVHSPLSYSRHAENLTQNYIAALRKNKANGFLDDYSDEEFETLAVILLGARVQLMSQFCFQHGRVRAIPERVIDTFMKFLATGFGAAKSGTKRPARPIARTSPDANGYSAEIVDASPGALTIRYDIHRKGATPNETDQLLQRIAADLLHRSLEALSPAGARLRSSSIHLFPGEQGDAVLATCRIDATAKGQSLAQFSLLGDTPNAGAWLAGGQALICHDGH